MTAALSHWLAMGGYAAFVWPAYAVAAIVLGGIALHSLRRHRRGEQALDELQRPAGSGE